jgi:HJR/Mrr/RecB family endonuclease
MGLLMYKLCQAHFVRSRFLVFQGLLALVRQPGCLKCQMNSVSSMPIEIRTPTEGDLSSLPRRAAAAYAARFARRLFLIVSENAPDAFDQSTRAEANALLDVAESLAAYPHMREWPAHKYFGKPTAKKDKLGMHFFLGQARKFELLSPAWLEFDDGQRFASDESTQGFSKSARLRHVSPQQVGAPVRDARRAVAAALWVASAIASAEVDGTADDSWASRGLIDVVDACNRSSRDVKKAMWDDFCCIRDQAAKHNWTHSTPVPSSLWALHSKFDLERLIDGRSILTISSFVNERLIAYFREHPQRLHALTPRQFEELIAELWHGFGFEVELTRPTIDGGCDVIAVQHAPLRVKYLIECKRYQADRTIGVHIVRQLGGVVLKQLVSSADQTEMVKGILATTSSFTSPAQAYLRETSYWLEGADSDRIIEWLEEYDRLRMATIF